jgi:hypothetical protein
MQIRTSHFQFLSFLFSVASLVMVTAQVPDALLHSIPAPPGGGGQTGALHGSSVAIDGGYTVIGAPNDDVGGTDSGVVSVFDSATGTLLFVLLNPAPAASDFFGNSVAISGTRVVVGACQDDTGATNTGSAYVYDLSSATPKVPVVILNNPGPAAGDQFGWSVAITGTRLVVGAHQDDTGATNSGIAYVYELSSGTPTIPVTTLNNPAPTANDQFGYSMAISGMRLVVGTPNDDTGATDAGSAYLYDLSSATPALPIATLNNPSPVVSDLFGSSVAISGTRIVAGAYQDDTGTTDAGSAYLYDLISATPTLPIAVLNNPGPAATDRFGWSVAISGTRVVVGAYQDDTGATNAGSAYVYELIYLSTVPVATLNNPGPAASDQFGYSVAISGTRLVAGVPSDDTRAANAGIAYLYDLSSGMPSAPVFTLNHSGASGNDYFGISVAMAGTLFVVGAMNDSTGASGAGSVYVFDLTSGTPTIPIATLNNPSPAIGEQFGNSVAISGTRVVVGARRASSVGSVYLYDLASATPTTPFAALNNPNPDGDDFFGTSVAISGTRIVVGADHDDIGVPDAGSAYVYDLTSATPTVPLQTLTKSNPSSNDYFGGAVAIFGEWIVIGASHDDTGATNAGSAYVYNMTSGTPTAPVWTLNNPNPTADATFGQSVSISGNRAVVGAQHTDTGANNAGSAYVYDLSGLTPTEPTATLNNPNPADNDYFGSSVAISGTRVVVGAIFGDTGATDAGSAYLYDLSSATPTVPLATLNSPSPSTSDWFGAAVAIDAENVLIGASQDDTTMADKGAAYVFGPAPPPQPEISVEMQPSNTNIVDGSPHDVGICVINNAKSLTFTVKNTGRSDLILSGTPIVALTGADAAMFSVTRQPSSPLDGPIGFTTFTVRFLPTSGGVKVATLTIPNNDSDESPFAIPLTGNSLTFTNDSDSDGLNDASEFQCAALGFDWQVNQAALVDTYYTYSNGAGLYTSTQVQALYVGTPLIERNPTTGIFKLTIGVEKSSDLSSFNPFPMTAPQTMINDGKLEFQFTVPDNAAFFRVQAQ